MKRPQGSLLNPNLMHLFGMEPKKSDLRRLQIIEACIESVTSLGLDGMSLDAVGKRLDMSRSQVLYYFPDRGKLLESVIQFITFTAQNHTVSLVDQAASPKEKLCSMIHATFDWAEKYPKHAKVMTLFYHFCTAHSEYRKLHTRIRNEGCSRIAELITLIRDQGKSYIETPQEVARAIQAQLTGCLIETLTTQIEFDFKKTEQKVIRLSLLLAKT